MSRLNINSGGCRLHWILSLALFALSLSGCAGSTGGAPRTNITAPRALVSIAVTPGNSSIAKGSTEQLTATGSYSDGSTQNLTDSVTWSSSNPALATVASAGLATGAAIGSVTIQAALASITGSAALTVTPPTLSSISISPINLLMPKGATQQFSATGTFSDGSTQNVTDNVTWTSSIAGIATVNATGLVNALTVGTTTIQASFGSAASSASLTVTSAALSSLAISPANSSIAKGTSQQFTAIGTLTDGSSQNLTNFVTWSSSNSSIATVNGSGLATGMNPGNALVQGTSGSITGSAALTVTPPALSSIAVLPANPALSTGATLQFKAVGTYSDGSTQDLTNSVSWTSSNPAVATINTMGLAVAISVGASNVQAALNGINVSTTLAINSAVTVAVSPVSVKLTVSTGTQQFVATVGNDPQNGGVNWNLSGAGCSGAACGTLSATSSASGASITYNAPPAVPSPATLTLTATSVSDSTISNSALITITNGSTPVGSTFTESFSSSNPCWANGPSSCDQGWVAQGSAQAIVATPGAPPPNTAGSNALQMTEPSGSAAYIYTAGSFPRIPSGTQFDLYFMIDVASQAMNASDATRLLTLSAYADGSAYPAQVSLLYDGVNLQLQAGGATFTAKTNISLNSWHSVQLHVASGSNSSFLSIDRGPASPFTENPQDFADLLIGSVAGNFDALTYYIGNVYVNSPLGGGPPPSAYIDFENSTNGTNVTPAILAASTHCGNGVWSLSMTPMTGMAISTGGQETLPSPITTCGTQYTDTGTQGLQYDMSQAARTARYTWSTVSSSASVGFFFQITVSDSNYYSAFNIDGGGGSDYATLNVHGGSMYLETKQGITNPVAISPNVWYWVTIQYNAGGTHYMQVYDGTSFALLGSVSNTATGNFPPTDIEIGRTGSENGFPSAFWYYDNIVIDYLTAKFPILPGSY